MKLDYRDVIKNIQSGKVEPVYFLNGNDFYLQDYFVQRVEKSLKLKNDSFAKVSLMPTTGETAGILQDLQTIPLFPEPKLFVIRNPSVFIDKARKELLDYCESPNSSNYLILIIDDYDWRKELNKQLADIIGQINTSPPFESQMGGKIRFLFKQANLEATDQAVEHLQELAGDTVYHAANEIEKISLGVEKGSIVSDEDVFRYAGWNRNYSPKDLQDAVGRRDLVNSLRLGGKLLDGGMQLSALIGYITTLFLEMNFRNIRMNGEKLDKRELWLSKDVRKKMPQYQALYREDELKSIFSFLLEADKDVKNSASEDDRILVSLFHRIIRGND